MAGLRRRCAQVRAAAQPGELERHEALRRRRYLRHWSEADGAFRLDARLTPEAGAVVLAALEPEKARIFADARAGGRREPYDAYAADALVSVAETAPRCHCDGSRSGPGAHVHVRVDHSAFVRGFTIAGETCEIPGIGPIPVASARALASDAVLSALVADGVDVRAVAHLGRTIPAHLRSALEARDPVCVVPGCDVRDNLEIDHIVPVAEGGPTRLSNLDRLCGWHHYLKTHRGYVLSGGPGSWCLTPPGAPQPDDQAAPPDGVRPQERCSSSERAQPQDPAPKPARPQDRSAPEPARPQVAAPERSGSAHVPVASEPGTSATGRGP
ncbi:hypothetical protein BH24ACT26_BH24ACT26_22830 [soil metagenome]